MKTDTKTLLAYLEGTLPPEEAEAVREILASDAPARRDLAALQQLQTTLCAAAHESAEASISPFLVDKVMRRIGNNGRSRAAEDLESWLLRWFRPVVAASVLLVGSLMIYNVNASSQHDATVSATESIFGIPPVTLVAAYELTAEGQ